MLNGIIYGLSTLSLEAVKVSLHFLKALSHDAVICD